MESGSDVRFSKNERRYSPFRSTTTSLVQHYSLERCSIRTNEAVCGFEASSFRPYKKVADFDLDEISAAQLAVDRQIEERPVSQTPFPIEKETYRPYLFQRAFRANFLARIPSAAIAGGRVKM